MRLFFFFLFFWGGEGRKGDDALRVSFDDRLRFPFIYYITIVNVTQSPAFKVLRDLASRLQQTHPAEMPLIMILAPFFTFAVCRFQSQKPCLSTT